LLQLVYDRVYAPKFNALLGHECHFVAKLRGVPKIDCDRSGIDPAILFDIRDRAERNINNPKRRHSTIGYLSPVEFESKLGLAEVRVFRVQANASKPAAEQLRLFFLVHDSLRTQLASLNLAVLQLRIVGTYNQHNGLIVFFRRCVGKAKFPDCAVHGALRAYNVVQGNPRISS
jgi:hypothetical protein